MSVKRATAAADEVLEEISNTKAAVAPKRKFTFKNKNKKQKQPATATATATRTTAAATVSEDDVFVGFRDRENEHLVSLPNCTTTAATTTATTAATTATAAATTATAAATTATTTIATTAATTAATGAFDHHVSGCGDFRLQNLTNCTVTLMETIR